MASGGYGVYDVLNISNRNVELNAILRRLSCVESLKIQLWDVEHPTLHVFSEKKSNEPRPMAPCDQDVYDVSNILILKTESSVFKKKINDIRSKTGYNPTDSANKKQKQIVLDLDVSY